MARPAPRAALTADISLQAFTLLLRAAAADGSLEHLLLQTGGSDGLTPLGWAARNGHRDMAQLVLAHMPERQVLHRSALGHNALSLAAKQGHAELCEQLLRYVPEQQLAHVPDADSPCCSRNTALILAAANGHVKVVKALLVHIPERQVLHQNQDGVSALYAAVWRNSPDVVAVLLRYATAQQISLKGRQQYTVLHLAASKGYVTIMQQLLAAHDPVQQVLCTDENGCMPVHLATTSGHTDAVRCLLAHSPEQQLVHHNDAGMSAMLYAADKTNVAVLRLLLSCAHNPEQLLRQTSPNRMTPLSLAATRCSAAAVQLLLQHSPDWQVQQSDEAGQNTLMYALATAMEGEGLEVVRLLLRHSPEAQVQHLTHDQATPLMMAAQRGAAAAMQLLLQHSPDWQVQQVDKEGYNALMYALHTEGECEGLEMMRLLLRHSPEAQVQQVSPHGMSVLICAMKKNRTNIVRELLQHCPDQQVTAGRSLRESPLCMAVEMAAVHFVEEIASHVTDPSLLALGLMGATASTLPLFAGAMPATIAKAQLRCCQLLLAAGADPTTLAPEQLSDFRHARLEVQKLVQAACRRRRKGQRPAQDEQAEAEQVEQAEQAEAEQAEARAEQAAAALLAEEEADRAKAQAAQAKKDKKKQKKAAAKAREAAAQADTAGQDDGARKAGAEGGAAAEEGVSDAWPPCSSGGGAASTLAGSFSSGGGVQDGVQDVSSGNNDNASALKEAVSGADARSLLSSNAECDRWCVVCLERHSCQALVPCGHIVMCGPCCEAVQASKNECPMCREGILAVLAINTANL